MLEKIINTPDSIKENLLKTLRAISAAIVMTTSNLSPTEVLAACTPGSQIAEKQNYSASSPDGKTLIIHRWDGTCGPADKILAQIMSLGNSYEKIVIEGPCSSACAIFAEKHRKKIVGNPEVSFHCYGIDDGNGNRTCLNSGALRSSDPENNRPDWNYKQIVGGKSSNNPAARTNNGSAGWKNESISPR